MVEQTRRIGILGGSFDPIHFGHIKPSLELIDKFQLQQIRFVPCKVSPFKEATHTSDMHRWNMVNLITGNHEQLIADARELERDTPSYSFSTLQEMRAELEQSTKLFWILGADALAGLPNWHKADEIMQLCHVLVLRRASYDADKIVQETDWLQAYVSSDVSRLEQDDCGTIFITDTQMLEISSTAIRESIQAGEQPKYMLPGGVWNYIKRNELYQNN